MTLSGIWNASFVRAISGTGCGNIKCHSWPRGYLAPSQIHKQNILSQCATRDLFMVFSGDVQERAPLVLNSKEAAACERQAMTFDDMTDQDGLTVSSCHNMCKLENIVLNVHRNRKAY